METTLNPAALRPLYEALKKIVRLTSTIEVLGEWEVQDINQGLRKTERKKVDSALDECGEALRLATLPASDSPTAPETSSPFVAEGQAICDGEPPVRQAGGGGELVKWTDLKPGDWYECRTKEWHPRAQKSPIAVLSQAELDTRLEFRRCEPPQWWKDHQAEKLHASLEKEYGLKTPATEDGCIHTMRTAYDGSGDYCVKCGWMPKP